MWIPGQQDDLVGRGTCTQALLLKFSIYIPQVGRRELTPSDCTLTFTYMP